MAPASVASGCFLGVGYTRGGVATADCCALQNPHHCAFRGPEKKVTGGGVGVELIVVAAKFFADKVNCHLAFHRRIQGAFARVASKPGVEHSGSFQGSSRCNLAEYLFTHRIPY